MNLDLPEWVATDATDYVTRAVAHASDVAGLSLLRQGLRHRVSNSPLTDADRFADHFEAALRGMWREWCASALHRETSTESTSGFKGLVQRLFRKPRR
jgi:protein O-GlcNAc transferase